MSEKEQVLNQPEQIAQEPPSLPMKQIQKAVESDLTQKYCEVMGSDPLTNEHLSALISKIPSNGEVSYKSHYFHDTISVKVTDHAPNYQIVTLHVMYGFFRCSLTVYCQPEESYSHNLPNKGNHQSSNVFIARTKKQTMVIKCYSVQNPEQFSHIFAEALKEFCLQKIAHSLGVGPKIIKIGGFDLILSQKCVEFGMQKCQQIINVTQKLNLQTLESDLVQKLKILHAFHMVHVDIKPQNIMYSEQGCQLVFIDFGFSKLVKEKIGFRSKTEFAGSINYCSPQMRSIVSSQTSQNLVDLYHNDAYSLKVTLEELAKLKEESGFKLSFLNSQLQQDDLLDLVISKNAKLQQFCNQQDFSELKMMLYFRKEEIFDKMQSQNNIISIFGKKLIEFILEFPYYKYFERAFEQIAKTIKDKRHLVQYLRRIEFKKQNLLQIFFFQVSQCHVYPQTNYFMALMGLLTDKNEFNLSRIGYSMKIQLKQHLNVKLTDYQFIETLSEEEYNKLVAEIVDLRSSISSFQEKVQISKVFNCKTSIKKSFQTVSHLFEIELCFKTLLFYYMTANTNDSKHKVPLILENLVIMEAISTEEILEIIDRVTETIDNSIIVGLFLFRISCLEILVCDKIMSRYIRKQLYLIDQKIQKYFEELIERKTELSIVNLLYAIKTNSVNNSKIVMDDIGSIDKLLKQRKQIDSEDYKQIMNFAIYYKYMGNMMYSSQNCLKGIIDMHQYGGLDMKNEVRLDAIHLKLYQMCHKKATSADKPQDEYEKIIKCLLQANLAHQFSFYYASFLIYHKSHSQEQRIFKEHYQSMCYLLSVLKEDEFPAISSIIAWIQIILRKVVYNSNSETIQKFEDRARTFFNCQFLFDIHISMQDGYSETCYRNLYYITSIYYQLYECQDEQIQMLRQFFDFFLKQKQLNNQDCIDCRKSYEHTIRNIQITLAEHEGRYQQGVNICLQQLYKFLASPLAMMGSASGNLTQFLGKLTILLNELPKVQETIKYFEETYTIIEKHNLFQLVFDIYYGKQISMFLSQHTLIANNSISKYLTFHLHLLNLISDHPFSLHINFYIESLGQFTTKYSRLFKESINQIILHFFSMIKQNQICNPYNSLFLSFFLHFKLQDHLYHKIVVYLCKSLDLVSLQVRFKVMSYLTQFISGNTIVVSEGRSKMRKITMFANYLIIPGSYKRFCKRICWKHRTKSKGHQNYHLISKQKLFYDNLII